jgi:predicted SnoaL-like aldol condensation-catalyzing enzyme
MDIFRLDRNGKVAEQRGVLRRAPENPAHDNTMF